MIGETVLFSLNITRIDEIIQPDYNVTLDTVLILPLDNILVASLDHLNVTSTTKGNEMRTKIILDPLSNNSGISLSFEGVVSEVVQLLGFIEYEADPTNGHVYLEPITFPVIYIMHFDFSFSLLKTSLQLENGLVAPDEMVTWRAEIENIRGLDRNLSLTIEFDGSLLSIANASIVFIG